MSLALPRAPCGEEGAGTPAAALGSCHGRSAFLAATRRWRPLLCSLLITARGPGRHFAPASLLPHRFLRALPFPKARSLPRGPRNAPTHPHAADAEGAIASAPFLRLSSSEVGHFAWNDGPHLPGPLQMGQTCED